jgi:hypothetical protein
MLFLNEMNKISFSFDNIFSFHKKIKEKNFYDKFMWNKVNENYLLET